MLSHRLIPKNTIEFNVLENVCLPSWMMSDSDGLLEDKRALRMADFSGKDQASTKDPDGYEKCACVRLLLLQANLIAPNPSKSA